MKLELFFDVFQQSTFIFMQRTITVCFSCKEPASFHRVYLLQKLFCGTPEEYIWSIFTLTCEHWERKELYLLVVLSFIISISV